MEPNGIAEIDDVAGIGSGAEGCLPVDELQRWSTQPIADSVGFGADGEVR